MISKFDPGGKGKGVMRFCWPGMVGYLNACETSKPYPTCSLKLLRNPLKFLDTTFPITLPALIESVSSNMAQKSSRNLSITDNINSFNNVINVNTGISDEDNQVREWLSPLKPQQRHQDVRSDRLDGVGDWFLETSEFRRWSNREDESRERVLFCSGGPGVGKTYLW